MSKLEKKGLVPKLRFPEFLNAGDWTTKELKLLLEPYSERVSSDTELDVYSSTRLGLKPQRDYYDGRQLINEGEYGVVPDAYFVYRHMSDDNTFKFNINKLGKRIAVSKEYPVFKTIGLNSEFLLNVINEGRGFKLFAESQKKGGTRTRLYFKTLCSYKPPLPLEDEQRKIADCLSSLDELVTAQSQKLEALKAHKKGLMQQLFPAEGETVPKLRFSEFRGGDEWVKYSFGRMLKINSGKGFKAAEYSKVGVKLLQIENVGYGITKWNDNTIYLPENYCLEYPELVLKNGDVVLALNRPVTNGELKIAKITQCDEPSILYQRVGKLELIDEALNFDFIFHLSRDFIKKFVLEKSIGSDQPFISLRELYAQKVLIPASAEQQKIADFLSSIDNLISAQVQKIESLKSHKKGLMQQLFPAVNGGLDAN